METRRNGEAAGSYESRNDLALRSAASDPAAEPQLNPPNTQGPELEAAQSKPESNAQGLKSKHSRKISVNGPKARQPQSKDAPDSQVVKENATPSNSTANQAMTTSLPDFVVRRNELFDKFKRQRHAEILEKEKPEINVVLDLGLDKQGKSRAAMPVAAKAWESTPGSFLKHLDKDFSSDIVIAKVDGKELWDLDRPLEYGCRVSYVPFSSTEGRNVFWHSCAHVLGEACECQFNCLLSHGPPVEQGFFYDMAIAEGQVVKEVDWAPLEKKAAQFFKEKQPFERLHVSIPGLKEMFGYSKYKMYYIENLLPSEGSTVYKCGSLVDLCLGPHIQNTGKIKAFQIMKNSSCYFRGDKNDDSLQRIYGVAFPEKKQMTAHKKFLEEASKRDHRKIGAEQELFFFDDVSPGNAFFLPHGTIIFNALQKLLRSEYQKRGYQEVQTPNMYDVDLWKISGHWQHYRDDMFSLEVEKKKWALKPMNCPGHCIIFGHRERSYRELPLRMADFGVLHRNEASGALNGMTRVRRFQQDDTHIFCTQDQITQEIEGLFDFLKCIYGLFGFPFKLELSTRPEKYLGDLETWEIAESKLKEALDEFTASGGGQWELNEGDGAFYGPKIDIGISDALKREFQCATIQLDFQLPQNFELEYMTAETGSKPKATESVDAKPDDAAGSSSKPKAPGPGRARPVMIHRAIVGSFERFIAIMTEHFAGKWPFWLSPRQVLVIPVMPTVNDYVEEVQHLLRAQKMHADIDISGNTMKKKILTGQLAQYNFIFVVGAQEKESRSVNIRNRDDQETQSKGELIPLDEAMRKLKALRKERRLINSI
ncbi:MAG: threonyl-tRNA synthetase [Alectoria sarmentosa]|nr:MAG: threonyl-tRNA synthetase [Alectoria sarmentosa]